MDKLQQARAIISEVDAQMASLFERRMEAAALVAQYKQEHGLPIFDGAREKEILEQGAARVSDPALREHYARFLQNNMEVSKAYQRQLMTPPKVLSMELGARSYDIFVERGGLSRAGEYFDLERRVCIVTDAGVPETYAKTLANQCKTPFIFQIPIGETAKTIATFEEICRQLSRNGFTRKDCVAAVGGGLVGDLAGFAAAAYMRGIDFYNIPTTLLAQVDASIGGKTGVNLAGMKNLVGAFWQPRGVLIDPDTLATLSPRLRSEGMAEVVKMALCLDAHLFETLENTDPRAELETILRRALLLKKQVVERDERESGLRKVLNFGHTIGHGIETAAAGTLYHGECVAVGMMPMVSPQLAPRLKALLEKLGLPTSTQLDKDAIWAAMLHDKKSDDTGFSAVFVDEPGKASIRSVSFAQMKTILEGGWQA